MSPGLGPRLRGSVLRGAVFEDAIDAARDLVWLFVVEVRVEARRRCNALVAEGVLDVPQIGAAEAREACEGVP